VCLYTGEYHELCWLKLRPAKQTHIAREEKHSMGVDRCRRFRFFGVFHYWLCFYLVRVATASGWEFPPSAANLQRWIVEMTLGCRFLVAAHEVAPAD